MDKSIKDQPMYSQLDRTKARIKQLEKDLDGYKKGVDLLKFEDTQHINKIEQLEKKIEAFKGMEIALEHCMDEGIKSMKENLELESKNQALKKQIEKFKKDYPFFDDADSGDYTINDGKPLEDKDGMSI